VLIDQRGGACFSASSNEEIAGLAGRRQVPAIGRFRKEALATGEFMDLGFPEVLVILVLALLLFGPSKLPSLGRSMGEAIRGFKKGLNDAHTDDKSEKSNDQISYNQRTETNQTTQATERSNKS
jgi:sec-independent protein translocase protein TatA